MEKISLRPTNDYCPQPLFLYGTRDEEGRSDFGLFCWFSYLWDGELGVMACIGGEKQTKDNIHRTKVFSANMVTEALLPLADHLGNASGRDPRKMDPVTGIGEGKVLPIPVLTASPVVYELEVRQFIPMDDEEVMLCRIRGVLRDANLPEGVENVTEELAVIAPVSTTCRRYFGWDGRDLGAWGEPRERLEGPGR